MRSNPMNRRDFLTASPRCARPTALRRQGSHPPSAPCASTIAPCAQARPSAISVPAAHEHSCGRACGMAGSDSGSRTGRQHGDWPAETADSARPEDSPREHGMVPQLRIRRPMASPDVTKQPIAKSYLKHGFQNDEETHLHIPHRSAARTAGRAGFRRSRSPRHRHRHPPPHSSFWWRHPDP